jgi:fused signal recognition particle receptor
VHNAPTGKEIIEINDEYFDDLLERFIKSDIGFDLSEKIIQSLKKNINEQKITQNELNTKIKEGIKLSVEACHSTPLQQLDIKKTNILFVVGINGSGKTTSIGKLAKKYKEEAYKVLIVAADTFRAAAGEQLDIWAEKAGVDIFSPPEVKRPDAVVFSAIEKAKKENYNLLLIDTAGRLQSQKNLMEELKKIDSVIEKNAPDAIKEKLIVLDATIGQNAIVQAKEFLNVEACPAKGEARSQSERRGMPLRTGIILSKLDGSAKGGVVLGIMNDLSLPVKFIGTGEKIDDIVDFNFDEYLEGMLS